MHSTSTCSGDVCSQTCERRNGGLCNFIHPSLLSLIVLFSKCKLGSTVGYAIRFEDCTSSETKIKCMEPFPRSIERSDGLTW